MKSIVTLGWSIWTCNSKSLQVYAEQGSLLGSQQEAADLASRLTAAEHREAVLKAALANEQASHQSDARLALARDAKAAADLQAAADKVRRLSTGQLLASTALHCPSTCLHCPSLPSTTLQCPSLPLHSPPLPSMALHCRVTCRHCPATCLHCPLLPSYLPPLPSLPRYCPPLRSCSCYPSLHRHNKKACTGTTIAKQHHF